MPKTLFHLYFFLLHNLTFHNQHLKEFRIYDHKSRGCDPDFVTTSLRPKPFFFFQFTAFLGLSRKLVAGHPNRRGCQDCTHPSLNQIEPITEIGYGFKTKYSRANIVSCHGVLSQFKCCVTVCVTGTILATTFTFSRERDNQSLRLAYCVPIGQETMDLLVNIRLRVERSFSCGDMVKNV